MHFIDGESHSSKRAHVNAMNILELLEVKLKLGCFPCRLTMVFDQYFCLAIVAPTS